MLRTRVLTAIALLALLGLAAAWSRLLLGDLCAALVAVALYEWLRLAGHRAAVASGWAIAFGAALMLSPLAGFDAPPALVAAASALACLLWLGLAVVVVRANRLAVRLGSGTSTALACGVLLAAWLGLTHLLQMGVTWLVSMLAIVWIADIAAYFTGRALGRHKLAPRISPGKTWEGVGGAMAGVVLIALSVQALWPRAPIWTNHLLTAAPVPAAVLALAALVALSIVGDLFESLLKRQAGVKDSGRLLPGHGGVLDRIDATLPALPAAILIDWWAR